MGVCKYTELIHYRHAYVYKYTELPVLKEASLPAAPVGAAPSPVLLSGAAGEGAERAALVATLKAGKAPKQLGNCFLDQERPNLHTARLGKDREPRL